MNSAMALFGAFVTGILLGSGSLFYAWKLTVGSDEGSRAFIKSLLDSPRGRKFTIEALENLHLHVVPCGQLDPHTVGGPIPSAEELQSIADVGSSSLSERDLFTRPELIRMIDCSHRNLHPGRLANGRTVCFDCECEVDTSVARIDFYSIALIVSDGSLTEEEFLRANKVRYEEVIASLQAYEEDLASLQATETTSEASGSLVPPKAR